jgi:hypothetical protein
MARRDRPVRVVPVWRQTVDRKQFVLALLALVEQLAAEGASDTPELPGDNATERGGSDA